MKRICKIVENSIVAACLWLALNILHGCASPETSGVNGPRPAYFSNSVDSSENPTDAKLSLPAAASVHSKTAVLSLVESLIPSRAVESVHAKSLRSFSSEDTLEADLALWEELIASESLTSRDRVRRKKGLNAIVGLKAPGAVRGVWRSQILLKQPERLNYEAAILKIPGVSKVWQDKDIPVIGVQLENYHAMVAVRRLPFVDYIVPRYFQGYLAASAGCNNNSSGGNISQRATNGISTKIAPGDILPWNYTLHSIPEAWALSPNVGANITIGAVDTGVYQEQEELDGLFATEMSANRTVILQGSLAHTPWDECNHGTRVIGLMTAPRNGKNIVGVAYRANLVSIKSANSPIIYGWDSEAIVEALRLVRDNGARIINLAFGNPSYIAPIADRIRFDYYREDIPNAVYVGAVGTDVCNSGSMFPANMPEVIGVSGVAADKSTPSGGSCAGPDTDVAAVIGDADVEATGRHTSDVVNLGGSSGASAMISGILALIWSEYPWMNRDEVTKRLYWAGPSSGSHKSDNIGYGVPDAYKAVGGFAGLRIDGPNQVEPGGSYALVAIPSGDGPFSYSWSTGETTPSIQLVAGPGGSSQSFTVTVKDSRLNKSLTAEKTVRIRKLPASCPSGKKCCEPEEDGCRLCVPVGNECP